MEQFQRELGSDEESEVGKPLAGPNAEWSMRWTDNDDERENVLSNVDNEVPDETTRCGFGCFSPEWLQVFASKKAFMVVFALLAVIQGSSWAYFSAT